MKKLLSKEPKVRGVGWPPLGRGGAGRAGTRVASGRAAPERRLGSSTISGPSALLQPAPAAASSVGNLLGRVSFHEPTTVEDCDSTWQTEPEQPGPVGGGEGQEHDEPEQPEQPPERAGGRPGASPVPEEHAEAAGAEQGGDSTEGNAKPKRSFYAARVYKYRHQYPNFKNIRYQNYLSNLRFYKNKIPFKPDGVFIKEVLNKWKGDYERLEHKSHLHPMAFSPERTRFELLR